jgi:predicted transcriptional regulator
LLERRKARSTLLLLTLILFVSFIALTCAPYNHGQLRNIPRANVEGVLAFPAFSMFNLRSQNEASTLLNQSTRMSIYCFVENNPGLHFRALSTSLNLPIGVLQYHLGLLVSKGLLSTYQNGRYKRYFKSKSFSEAAMKVISLLRNGTSGKIVAVLFAKPQTTHKDLAARLSISSQALSWQMRRLEKMGVVSKSLDGLSVKYSLTEPVCSTISQYAPVTESLTIKIKF